MKFELEKFKQSNVARIFIAYAVVAFGMMQIFDYLLPIIEAPLWVAQTLTLLLFLGFPISLLVGWVTQRPVITSNTEEVRFDSGYAHSLSRQKLILLGLGSSVIFGFLGFISMPYLLDQASFSSQQSVESESVEIASIQRSVRTELNLGETGVHPFWGFKTQLALSPDGTELVYVENNPKGGDIFIRDLLNLDSDRLLASYSGGASGFLSFSSDGEWVIYLDSSQQKRVRVEGGAPQTIIGDAHNGGSFGDGGEQVFYTERSTGRLKKVNTAGGESDVLTSNANSYFWPVMLPNKTHLLVTKSSNVRAVASTSSIVLIDLATLEEQTLIESAFNARYANSGHITFSRDSAVWAVPFDAAELKIVGDQVPVILEVETDQRRGTANYSFSENGRLVYVRGGAIGGSGGLFRLIKFDRNGSVVAAAIDQGQYGHLALSPNERQMALTVYEGTATSDIWIWDLNRDILGRRTFEGDASRAIWTPDGQTLVYSVINSEDSSRDGLWTLAANGTSQPSQLFPAAQAWARTISPDNKLLFSLHVGEVGAYSMDLEREFSEAQEREAVKIELAPSTPMNVQMNISPNGNWVAYNSNETGVTEVYVRPFPNIEDGKWQVSIGGGVSPLWSKNSTEIFYWWSSDQFSVSYSEEQPDASGQPTFLEFERPERIAGVPIMGGQNVITPWTFSSERDEFTAISSTVEIESGPSVEEILADQVTLVAVENWFTELSSLAPPNFE